jgi:outer membrane protein
VKKLLAIILVLTFVTPAMAEIIVGKVNIQKILVSVKEGKQVKDKLKKEFEKKQKTLKKEESKIRKAQENFKKQSLVMNPNTKQKKEMEIQQMIVALQKKSMGFQKEIQGMEQKLKTPILEKIQKVIKTISKNAGVDMTFEVSTAPIVYAKTEKDLTDLVIKAYDKKH